MNKYPSVILLITFILSQAAMADSDDKASNGWYVGASLGHSDTMARSSNRFSHEESVSSYGFYGGKNLTDWAGFEFFFTRTDKVSDDQQNIEEAVFYSHGMASKFTYNLNDRLSLFAKLGLAAFVYRQRGSNFLFDEEDWSDLVPTYGLGAQMGLTNSIKVRLSYNHFKGTLEDGGNFFRDHDVKAKMEQLSLGLHYQF